MSIILNTNRDYFVRKFGGAMFFDSDGTPCALPCPSLSGMDVPMFTNEAKVRAIAVTGSADRPVKEERILEPEFFDSMAKFAVPALGWRSAAGGRVMMYLTGSTRTYKKGVCLDSVQFSYARHTRDMFETGNVSHSFYGRPYVKLAAVMRPKYMSLQEGLAAMNAGDIMGFAVSQDLAVLPNADDTYLVAYANQIVGTISPSGTATLHIPRSMEDLV